MSMQISDVVECMQRVNLLKKINKLCISGLFASALPLAMLGEVAPIFTESVISSAQASTSEGASGKAIPEKFKQLLEQAEAGDVAAQSRIGLIFYSGVGLDSDYQAARYWFEKAAQKGHINALYMLSLIYLNGLGVEADASIAARYLQQASDKGMRLHRLCWADYMSKGAAFHVII